MFPSADSQRVLKRVAECDVPLVSVLRDTLGDNDPRNDRLLYVWLLSYVHPNIAQYLLSAMPFFYWKVGEGAGRASHSVGPLLNLTTPERSVVSGVGRQILQTGLLDPSVTPIRATSRAYHGNASDYQRLKLEQAATYLRRAPISPGMACLKGNSMRWLLAWNSGSDCLAVLLLEKMLLLPARRWNSRRSEPEAGIGKCCVNARSEPALSSNRYVWRVALARYGILWFPLGETAPSAGSSLRPIWKLLNLRNPWTDRRLKNWQGPTYLRAFDEDGALLPMGQPGIHQQQLIPLGVYSLDYPTAPLLLIDFRGSLHLRRHEMTQRAINDATAGVIGISHFTNWYYYAAADLYNFVVSRHGAATSESARLDCYSQFRASLALDQELDPALRRPDAKPCQLARLQSSRKCSNKGSRTGPGTLSGTARQGARRQALTPHQ